MRLLDNLLQAIIPRSSPDEPMTLDMYSVMEDIGRKQRLKNTKEDGLTKLERAFMASRIAKRNRLDKQIKNDEVKHEELKKKFYAHRSVEKCSCFLLFCSFMLPLVCSISMKPFSLNICFDHNETKWNNYAHIYKILIN